MEQIKFETYKNLYLANKSQKFIIISKKKQNDQKINQPKFLTNKMSDQIERGFQHGLYYKIEDIVNDAGSCSNVEIRSKFTMLTPDELQKLPSNYDPTTKIIPTIEQFRYLFYQTQLILNPI